MNIFKHLTREDWWGLLGISLFLAAAVSVVNYLTN